MPKVRSIKILYESITFVLCFTSVLFHLVSGTFCDRISFSVNITHSFIKGFKNDVGLMKLLQNFITVVLFCCEFVPQVRPKLDPDNR